MSSASERRAGLDRRRRTRGGRRPTDLYGLTPLVIVAEEAPGGSRETCETILAKLHFAVAPVDSVAKALKVMSTLRPELIVAKVSDASLLREQTDVPLVEVTEALSDPDALVDAVRRAIRSRRVVGSSQSFTGH